MGTQELQVVIGEFSSKTVDDVPFMRNLGLGAEPASEGGCNSKTVIAGLEGHNVTPENRVLGPLGRDEGRRGGESWENAEGDSDELLGEHGGLELGFPSSKSSPYLSNFIHLTVQRMQRVNAD